MLKCTEIHKNGYTQIFRTGLFYKDITRKENYKSIYLMNKNTKILNKILTNLIIYKKECTMHHDQMGFCPRTPGSFNI